MFHKVFNIYFSAFFLIWALGIDQFYFVFLCAVGFFTLLANEKSFSSKEVLFFFMFVIATFFSITQISSTIRIITFLRNEGVYIAVLFVLLSASFSSAKEVYATDKLYFAILLFTAQCSIVAFLASIGITLEFKSVAGYFIPDLGLKYISSMLNKSTIQAEALWFSAGFFRPRGLMMYPNTMAGILASSLAIKGYFVYKFWRDQFKLLALLCIFLIYMDIFSIYSSLSRSTWIGLALALVIFPFAFRTNLATKLVPVLAGIAIIALVLISGLGEGIEARFFEKTHSNEGRGLNYYLIWTETTSSIEKFLIGHGTQIDHPQLSIPLGSHSTYLGIFFKFGILGSVFFLLFLLFLYARCLYLTKLTGWLNESVTTYIRPYFLCFALIIPVVQMMFIEVDVDLSYALYFAALVFLIGQEHRLVEQRITRTQITGYPALQSTTSQ